MTTHAIEQKVWGIAKESVRGTAETNPARFIPVGTGSEMNYVQQLNETEKLYGKKSKLAPTLGVLECTGNIADVDAEVDLIGELLYSCLGSVSSAQQGGSLAYKHTITALAGNQHPGYTIFIDRGEDIRKYALSTVSKVSIVGEVDQPIRLNCDVVAKGEEDGPASLSPSWQTPDPLIFSGVTYDVGGVQNTEIRNWTIDIDNQAVMKRALNNSRQVADLLVVNNLLVTGTYTVWFDSDTERDKFLAGTTQNLQMTAVGTLIDSTYYDTLDITLPEIYYKAFPFTDNDGMLSAEVEWEAYYNISGSSQITVDLTNAITSY